VVQEIEGSHAEAVLESMKMQRVESMKMQRVEVWQACSVARHELAVDHERAHAGQGRGSIDYLTDAA
jgi:hypothetical protein